MNDRKKKSATSRPNPSAPQESNKDSATKEPTGIDNRAESVRRYGKLEPEGYTRHVHGDREGEFQRGGKINPELPTEEGAPFKEARFRKEKDKRAVPSDQFGGKTFNDLPGDHDIADDLLKKPPTQGS